MRGDAGMQRQHKMGGSELLPLLQRGNSGRGMAGVVLVWVFVIHLHAISLLVHPNSQIRESSMGMSLSPPSPPNSQPTH